MEEFSELGDGFRIALRDLELRGAGNILGRQIGRINQIGLNLYCEMLSQAVEKLKTIDGGQIQPVKHHPELPSWKTLVCSYDERLRDRQ